MRHRLCPGPPSNANVGRARWEWEIDLWEAQVLLFLLFGLTGAMQTFMSPEALVPMGLGYATEIPYRLLRFIGIFELAGAAGIVLPAMTRIMPVLTPLAALGFVTIQVLAIGFHIMRGELGTALIFNLVLLGLSLFVFWGRTRKAPIPARG